MFANVDQDNYTEQWSWDTH